MKGLVILTLILAQIFSMHILSSKTELKKRKKKKKGWVEASVCFSFSLLISCLFLKVAAMFKIGNSKELPAIPDHLSEDGKDFVRQCLQRDPIKRPKAEQLLEHPFVKNAAPFEKPLASSDPPAAVTNGVKSLVHLSFNITQLFLCSCYWH